jgi:hypothetical protein
MNTKDIGDRTVAIILAALIRRGDTVLVPFGDNRRYDIATESAGKLCRIQCKTGRVENGTIRFKTCSTYAHRGRPDKHYRGEIELFGVYCPQTDKVYLVSVDEAGRAEGVLRIEPPRNGQKALVKYAKDYEVTPG